MLARHCRWLTGLMAFNLLVVTMAQAEPRVHRGTVVSASASKVVLKDGTGAEQSFTVDPGVNVVVHGKPGKVEDLQQTMPISVTTDEKGKVLAIATVDKHKRSDEAILVSL